MNTNTNTIFQPWHLNISEKRVKYSPSQISKPINLDFFFFKQSLRDGEENAYASIPTVQQVIFLMALSSNTVCFRTVLFQNSLSSLETTVCGVWMICHPQHCKSQLHQRHWREGEEKADRKDCIRAPVFLLLQRE